MQGNCSLWSQYLTKLSFQKCYAFLPCKGIAPFGRNILRIVTTEMLTHFFRARELLPLVAIFYELPFQKCLRISSMAILKFLSASAGAGVVAAYFGHCAHYGYVLTLPAALHC